MERPSQQRRARLAASTHEAIVDAAGRLFAERGYFATTVQEIAALADVSPATVYAVAGGKQGMITSLAKRWSDSSVLGESLRRLPTLTDPYEVVSYVGQASRQVREEHGGTLGTCCGSSSGTAATSRFSTTTAGTTTGPRSGSSRSAASVSESFARSRPPPGTVAEAEVGRASDGGRGASVRPGAPGRARV
ncbi:TetR/AcrR family transcriptional regulator [Streptomyces olivaceus]|nr:TetR/AcrR family transcriptional regulator [Streptomyces olivaceus]MBZ6249416.1 TetR/AcrR family transcriptional regulator [Streptomyces olivaceus]